MAFLSVICSNALRTDPIVSGDSIGVVMQPPEVVAQQVRRRDKVPIQTDTLDYSAHVLSNRHAPCMCRPWSYSKIECTRSMASEINTQLLWSRSRLMRENYPR